MAVHAKLSPVRPITDQIPVARVAGSPSYADWGFKSHTGLSHGVTVKSLIDGALANVEDIWVGFNKQPPVQMKVGDSFSSSTVPIKSVEFYNNSALIYSLIGFIYDGRLNP